MEPLASPDDCLLAEQIAKEDPKVQEQLKLRGITDMDLVACDPWSGVPIPPSPTRPCYDDQHNCHCCSVLAQPCIGIHCLIVELSMEASDCVMISLMLYLI